MKKFIIRLPIIAAVVAVALFAGQAFADAQWRPVDIHGRLSVDGNKIVDEQGRPVQLRGMSLYWSMGRGGFPFYNEDVVNWLADDWKVSGIRAAMGIRGNWTGDSGIPQIAYLQCGTVSGEHVCNSAGGTPNEDLVITVVEAAIERGIYVIIDWHSHTAHETPEETEAAVEFFKDMATRYKDVPNVIYEIYNEPIGSWGSTTFWSAMKPYSETLVSAIRDIDPNGIIILGTPYFSQRVDFATADPVEGDNLVYSLHFYAGDLYQGQPNGDHTTEGRKRAGAAMDRDKAIFVSEFGTCLASGKGDPDKDQTDIWFDFMRQHDISWFNWSLSNLDEGASVLKPTVTNTTGGWDPNNDLTETGKYIREKLIEHYEADYVTNGGKYGDWASVRPSRNRAQSANRSANWSVKRIGSGLTLTAPASHSGAYEIALYDVRGRQVRAQAHNVGASNRQITLGHKLPAGNYMLVVKNKASKRETYSTRVTILP